MGRKRRFGISLNENIAEKLDAICSVLNISRSAFVEDSIEFGVKAHMHYTVDHECEGILVAIWPSSSESASTIERAIELRKSVVKFDTHLHSNNNCVLIASLKGSSKKIAALHTELKKVRNSAVIYVPFCELIEENKASQ
jgi:CopG family nickel-responsive transcriptional regulator